LRVQALCGLSTFHAHSLEQLPLQFIFS
jgi:hypothetical protein